MSETVINDMEAQELCIEEICDEFRNNITDEGIRDFIFGEFGFSKSAVKDASKYIEYIKRVLVLSFYFVYACYRADMSRECRFKKLKSSNSKRVRKLLEETFVKNPVTQELVNFVLSDIQFDLVLGRDSELRRIFGKMIDVENGFSLSEYFNLLDEYNKAPGRFQYDSLRLYTLFLELVQNLLFLQQYNLLMQSNDLFVFERKRKEKKATDEMKLQHVMYRNDLKYIGGIYCLFKVGCADRGETSSNSSINLVYLSPDGGKTLSFTHSAATQAEHLQGQEIDEIYGEITGLSWEKKEEKKKDSDIIDRIHTINYKYIKNLALAITDAISDNIDAKRHLYEKYSIKYSYFFNGKGEDAEEYAAEPYKNPALDWDTIVVMLLIEESPTTILEFLFREVNKLLFVVAKNLYERAYNVEGLELFDFDGPESEEINDAVRDIINSKLVVGESAGFGQISSTRLYKKLFPRAAAMLILSKMSEMQETDYEESLVYTGNLRSNISLLENSKKDRDKDKMVKYSCIILGETFKHLICFYAGLFAYGSFKAEYDVASNGRCLSDNTIKEFQKVLEKNFIDAASEKAKSLSESYSAEPNSALELMEKFIEFCEECSCGDGTISTTSQYLYTAIGKYEIVSLRELKAFFKKLRYCIDDKRKCDEERWLDTTLEILEYLKTGSTPDTPVDSDLFNAVYPFTAVFNRRKENPDGYKTVTFSLNIDIDEDNKSDHTRDVNVLSEFEYRSDVYYCLPNVLRSNHKWWIDPVLIRFKDFNDIFSKDGSDI